MERQWDYPSKWDHINYLSDEILLLIFKELSHTEICHRCMLVCKRWRNILKAPSLVWIHVDFSRMSRGRPISGNSMGKLQMILKQKKFKGLGVMRFPNLEYSAGKMYSLLLFVQHLQTVSFRGCSLLSDQVFEVVCQLPSLCRLDITNCFRLTNKGLKSLRKLNHLRFLQCDNLLNLSDKSFEAITSKCDLLGQPVRSESKWNLRKLTGSKTKTSLKRLPSLPSYGSEAYHRYIDSVDKLCDFPNTINKECLELKLNFCTTLTNEFVENALAKLTSLSLLSLSYCLPLTDLGFEKWRAGVERAREDFKIGAMRTRSIPDLSDCTKEEEKEEEEGEEESGGQELLVKKKSKLKIKRVMKSDSRLMVLSYPPPTSFSVPPIKTLSLRGCNRITDKTLLALNNLTNLTYLDLSLCPKLTSKGLTSLLRTVPSLSYFNIKGFQDDVLPPFSAYPKHLSSLTRVTLSECPRVTDEVVELLGNHAHDLRKLAVSHSAVTIKTFGYVMEEGAFPSLSIFEIRGVHGMPVKQCREMKKKRKEICVKMVYLPEAGSDYWKRCETLANGLKKKKSHREGAVLKKGSGEDLGDNSSMMDE